MDNYLRIYSLKIINFNEYWGDNYFKILHFLLYYYLFVFLVKLI